MKRMLAILAFLITSLITATAQHSPVFVSGHVNHLVLCENGSAVSISSVLGVYDADTGQVMNWSVLAAPRHGTATVSFTDTTGGDTLSPAGLTYQPSTGFSGMDTFRVIAADTAGADTAWFFVTVNPLPNAGTITAPVALCSGTSDTIRSTMAGGTFMSSNTSATFAGNVLTGRHFGRDTIMYVMSNSCGVDTAFAYIDIDTAVIPRVDGRPAICLYDTTTLRGIPTGGTWINMDTALATVSSTGFVTGLSHGRDTILYVYTNVCGTDTGYRALAVDTLYTGTVAVTGATTVCRGDTTRLAGSPSPGLWSVGSATIATITRTGLVRGIAPGADTITYVYRNGCGSDTTTWPFTVLAPPPAAVLTGRDSVCVGSSVTLTASRTGGTWTSSDALFAAVSSTGVVTGGIRGTATISYSQTNSCGTTVATRNMQIDGRAEPIVGPSSICARDFVPATLVEAVPGGTFSSSNPLIAFVLGNYLWGVSAGTAVITYTLRNSCGTSTQSIIVLVEECSAGVDNVATTNVYVVPNPSKGNFTIKLPVTGDAKVTITDMNGREVATGVAERGTYNGQISTPGIYVVKLTAGDKSYLARLVIE